MVVVTGRAERYVDVQTVQDHVDACFQASLAGIDLAKCRKPGVPAWEGKGEVRRGRERKRGRKTERDRAKPKEGGEKKTVEPAGEERKRESRRSPSRTDCRTIVEWQSMRKMKNEMPGTLMEHRTHYAARQSAARRGMVTARHGAAWRGM